MNNTSKDPQYPIYIVSKNRADSRLTVKSLDLMGVPYSVVIEDSNYDDYARVIDPKKLLILNPKDPTAESMEFANSDTIPTTAIIKYTHSLLEATEQNKDNEQDPYQQNRIATDAMDWDICKQIRQIQESKTN